MTSGKSCGLRLVARREGGQVIFFSFFFNLFILFYFILFIFYFFSASVTPLKKNVWCVPHVGVLHQRKV
jgi:hypothetical protein